MTTATALSISFELEHGNGCEEFGRPLLEQLDAGSYRRCSVLEIPAALSDYLRAHRTARKRAKRAGDRGYIVEELKRELYVDAIHAINVSAPQRQGRPMSPGYRDRQEYAALPEYACERHAIRTTGVWSAELELVGYLVMYRCGELALVSQILGHAAHLDAEIMYQLFAGALAREIAAGPGFVVYNRHDSGTDGLRFYKARCGFEGVEVTWAP